MDAHFDIDDIFQHNHHAHHDDIADGWAMIDDLNHAEKVKPTGMPKTEFIRQYVKALDGKILTEQEHPEFVKAITDMAKELKLPYKPMVAVVDRIPIGGAWAERLPNAASLPIEGLVFCTKSMMDMSKSSANRAPTDALKSWFAHELSHLKYDKGGLLLGHYSPILLPAAAMTALLIYDKALKKTPKDENLFANMQQNIHQIADDEQKRVDDRQHTTPEKPWRKTPEVHKPLVEAGRYLAAGAAGLVGAYLLKRHISLSREFRADKVAVELVKAPEAFIQSLLDVDSAQMNEARKIIANPELLSKLKSKNIDEHLELGKALLDVATTHAHPTTPERIANITKVAANMAEKLHL